jgi:hypothetical protein
MPDGALKIARKQSASKLSRPAFLKISLGFAQQLIELARPRVARDLRIPSGPVALEDPLAKFSKFLAGELVYLVLNVFDLAHTPQYTAAAWKNPSSAANYC